MLIVEQKISDISDVAIDGVQGLLNFLACKSSLSGAQSFVAAGRVHRRRFSRRLHDCRVGYGCHHITANAEKMQISITIHTKSPAQPHDK